MSEKSIGGPWFHPTISNTRGSFLFISIGILIVVFLFSIQFNRYLQMQKKLSSRMGQQKILARVALGLASLAVHQLNFAPNCGHNDHISPLPSDLTPNLKRIYTWLTKPLPGMGDLSETPVALEEDPEYFDLRDVTVPLLAPLRENMEFEYQIQVSGREKDFEQCGVSRAGYSQEKKGLVHLVVKTTFSRGGASQVTEEFRFIARVKVTSALAPIFSKFSLYIEKADLPDLPVNVGFNAVQVKDTGRLVEGVLPLPLVLDNDGEGLSRTVETDYNDFVKAPRGLVYLGGETPVVLNLARSPLKNQELSAGEEFQFYRKGLDGALPFQTGLTGDKKTVIVSQFPKGVSNSDNTNNNTFYDLVRKYSTLGQTLVDVYRMQFASIFRLCGIESNKSPTLVLGNVKSGFLLLKFFSVFKDPPPSPPERREFLENLDYVVFKADIGDKYLPFAQAFNVTDTLGFGYPRYLKDYACGISSRSWNIGLGFMYRQDEASPPATLAPGSKLRRFMEEEPLSPDLMHGIPEPFQSVMTDSTPAGTTVPNDLKRMDPFVDLLRAPDRFIYEIPATGETLTAKEALARRGLWSGGRLDLNGWVKLKKPMSLDITEPTMFVSNGGILVEEGDINIRASVFPSRTIADRRDVVLQIVTLKGNIRLETPPGAEVRAGLIAGGDGITTGKIVFAGRPKLVGSLAMKRLMMTADEMAGFYGADMFYYPPLSALPKAPDDATSEKPLAAVSFDPMPILRN